MAAGAGAGDARRRRSSGRRSGSPGSDALAVRASKKLRSDELLVTALRGRRACAWTSIDVPLWRGDHVAVKQLVEDFARYLYLPRLEDSGGAA